VKENIRIVKPEDVLPVIRKWKKRREENFLTITLNNNHTIIKIHHITKGLVDRNLAHPRECFYHAILDYATGVIFIHNHPSGDVTPSHEDDDITHRLCMAGKLLGIKVLDHVIVTPQDKIYSYRKAGKIMDDYPVCELERFVESIAEENAL